ncbi:hypothetical protein T12_13526, partial [Trichinella patagoniensis]
LCSVRWLLCAVHVDGFQRERQVVVCCWLSHSCLRLL